MDIGDIVSCDILLWITQHLPGIPQCALHFFGMQWHQQDREFRGDASLGVPLFAIQLHRTDGELGFIV